MLGLDVVDGRVGGGEGAAVDALATLGLRVGARSGVRGAAGATDRRLAWPGAFEAAAAAAGGHFKRLLDAQTSTHGWAIANILEQQTANYEVPVEWPPHCKVPSRLATGT